MVKIDVKHISSDEVKVSGTYKKQKQVGRGSCGISFIGDINEWRLLVRFVTISHGSMANYLRSYLKRDFPALTKGI